MTLFAVLQGIEFNWGVSMKLKATLTAALLAVTMTFAAPTPARAYVPPTVDIAAAMVIVAILAIIFPNMFPKAK